LISPNFVHQSKRCQPTEFGKKFAVQFHQHSVTLHQPKTMPKTMPKFIRHLPKSIRYVPKKGSQAKKPYTYAGKIDHIVMPKAFAKCFFLLTLTNF